MPHTPPRAVLVTGARGNLGRKIVGALVEQPWCERIVGVDLTSGPAGAQTRGSTTIDSVAGDLTDPGGGWREAVASVDAIIHLAADNPDVDATWQQAARSFDMTVNVGLAAAAAGVRRLVFATSNHVMGGYKDMPLAAAMGPGKLDPSLPPAPGTRWHDGTRDRDSTAYATAKLMGERFCTTLAAQTAGQLSSVSIRIGWAQPGENSPTTISHAGSVIGGVAQAVGPDAQRDLRWFRNMWLSNADLCALFVAAVSADPAGWPAAGIVVNGTSANRDTDWDIASTQRLLGVRARSDLYAELDL